LAIDKLLYLTRMCSMADLGYLRQAATDLGSHVDRAEEEYRILAHDVNEKAKETHALVDFLRLTDHIDMATEEIFREILDMIPPLWQYPDETCAQIIFEGKEYRTTNFIVETPRRHAAEISINGQHVGKFEVFYLEEKRDEQEGVLIWENQTLVDAVARGIGIFVERKQASERLAQQARDIRKAKNLEREYAVKLDDQVTKLKAAKLETEESIRSMSRFLIHVSRHVHQP
jgi:hypothetical protein